MATHKENFKTWEEVVPSMEAKFLPPLEEQEEKLENVINLCTNWNKWKKGKTKRIPLFSSEIDPV
jgi:hypothetical protein